jgi:CRP-like cAMP-binding protein
MPTLAASLHEPYGHKTMTETVASPLAGLKLKMITPETRAALLSVAERVTLPAGTDLFREGDTGNALFVIESGQVTGVRAGRDEGDEHWPVLRLSAGEIVGEMAFMDGGPRHITARAETDCVLLKVSPEDLLLLDGGDVFYDNLRAAVGITVVQRLRAGTDIHVATLDHQLELAHTQHQFGQFFIYVIAMAAIGMVVNNIVATQIIAVNVYTELFAWQYLLVLLVPSLVVVRLMGIPIRMLGLTTKGLRKSLLEGGALSAALLALTTVVVLVSQAIPGLPAIAVNVGMEAVPGYFMHTFLQELLARGLFQNSFQRFLNDQRGYQAVFLSAILFGVFHIHFGFVAVLLTMVSSILFGLFYLRHQNLAGVTLVHFFAGAIAFSLGML